LKLAAEQIATRDEHTFANQKQANTHVRATVPGTDLEDRYTVLIGVQDSTDWQVAFSFSH